MNREARHAHVEVRIDTRAMFRGVELPQRFTAMPLIYDVVDDYGTIWTPGVFDGARLPVLCYGHEGWDDLTAVLGRAIDYTDRPEGPEYLYTFDDFEIVPTAAQAAHQLASGTLREFSVGFERRSWDGGYTGDGQAGPLSEADQLAGATERMISAEHLEDSIVIAGAVPGTKLLSMRGKLAALRAGEPGVFEDLIVSLARQIAAGELTRDEAIAAIDLAAGPTPPAPDPDPDLTPTGGTGSPPAPAIDDTMTSEADAAMEALGLA